MHEKTARILNLRKGRVDWYRIQNSSPDLTEVYIYDEIGYYGISSSDFVRDMQGIKTSTIELHLNTPGGDVFDGIAIYNAIKDHPATVNVSVDGIAASAGSFIAMAGDKIMMNRNSEMMIHDAQGLAVGNSTDMRSLADLLDKTSDNIASIYADRAGGTVASWRKAMKNETWYSADEAVKAGLADSVAGGTNKAENSWDLSIFNFAGRSSAPAPVIDQAPEFDFDAELVRQALQEVFQ